MHAEDQFGTTVDHPLHEKTFGRRTGVVQYVGGHLLQARADRLGCQIQGHAAGVALVCDRAAEQFQRNAAAERAGGVLRLRRIGDRDIACYGNAVACE